MVSEKGVYMILVIHHEKNDAKSLIHILRLGGLIVESAKPMEAFRYIDASLSAILCLSPEAFPCAEKYIEELHATNMGVPVFALTEQAYAVVHPELYSGILDIRQAPNTLLSRIRECQRNGMYRQSGDYRLGDINASVSQKEVTYRGEVILLTRKEKAILRYLICTAHIGAKCATIAERIYPKDCMPQPSCIRAHICAINKKFSRHLNHPLIVSVRESGYHIDLSPKSYTECSYI